MMLNLLGYRDEVNELEEVWPYNYAHQACATMECITVNACNTVGDRYTR